MSVLNVFMDHDFTVENICLVCYVPSGRGEPVHRNRPSHGLALHLAGERRYDFANGKSLFVGENDLIYLPKGSDYTVTALSFGGCYAINFDISKQVSFAPFVVHVKNAGEFLAAFQRAERVWKAKQHGFQMKCKEALYHILNQLQKEYTAEYMATSKAELLSPALAYIRENYTAKRCGIAELAAMCRVTPEYFRRIFGKFYGVSPLRYINGLRLSRAKELISSGLCSVGEAAELSGYRDAAYFSREFKKHFGAPPVTFLPEARPPAGE